MHRPRCAARADNLLVCEALANGDHFPRGSSAPGLRDAKALVTDSDTEDCPSAFGAVLVGHAVCSPAKGTDLERRAAGGLVREGPSDLLRRFSAGTQAGVGAGGYFLRVARGYRDGKSAAGSNGTADRRGLLRGLMAKVQLRGSFANYK